MLYLYFAYLLSVMNLSSIKILLPDIMVEFGMEINWLTWVVNSYTLPLAVMLPICGRLSDIYGHYRFFVLGVAVLALGSFGCGVASYSSILIVSRIIQAVGAAFLIPNSLVLLLKNKPIKEHSKIIGIWGSVGASGAVIGPIYSGIIIGILSWRGTFFCIALLLIFLLVFVIHDNHYKETIDLLLTDRKNFDIPGAISLIIALTSILIGFTLAPQIGWLDFRTLFLFFTFILFLCMYYKLEKLIAFPLLDLKMLAKPNFVMGLLICFLEQFVTAGTLFALPIYFVSVNDLTPVQTALMLTPTAISIAIVSPIGGRLVNQIGFGLPIAVGMILRAISYVMLSRISLNINYYYIALLLVINGVGFGLSNVPALNLVISTSIIEHHGAVAGIHNMIRFIGQSIGTTVVGIVIYSFLPVFTLFDRLNFSGPIPGFNQAFLLLAITCLPGLIIGIKLITRD